MDCGYPESPVVCTKSGWARWGRVFRSISNVCRGHRATRNSKRATDLPCLSSSNCFILRWRRLRCREGKWLYPRKINFLKGLCARGDELTHWHHSHVAVLNTVSVSPSSASFEVVDFDTGRHIKGKAWVRSPEAAKEHIKPSTAFSDFWFLTVVELIFFFFLM